MAKKNKSSAETMREWRKKNGPAAWLVQNYGLSIAEARAHIELRDRTVCAICGDAESQLVYDHDHATGRHRGWLCKLCNIGLGAFRDSPEFMWYAIEYLQSRKDQ